MVKFICNACLGKEESRYTGKMHGAPRGWLIGRKVKWPKRAPGEIHACSDECRRELQRNGHKGLIWMRVSKTAKDFTERAPNE